MKNGVSIFSESDSGRYGQVNAGRNTFQRTILRRWCDKMGPENCYGMPRAEVHDFPEVPTSALKKSESGDLAGSVGATPVSFGGGDCHLFGTSGPQRLGNALSGGLSW
ncbi:hypothetical protein GCM10009828_082850 [Actinoplanes couchii]|uniref:Uncharacterized protein n=1 Tax=Actinoplanes couchii TaxID=403638 RepID=A0ABQ3XKR1_9ACTN|nr:hypothetical protein Aco03nite_074900 [Actinoplanes couchii]